MAEAVTLLVFVLMLLGCVLTDIAVADKKYFYHKFISLHKPSNLDITGCPALFSFFVFCPKPTLIFINLRKFTGKWCSKWCSNLIPF